MTVDTRVVSTFADKEAPDTGTILEVRIVGGEPHYRVLWDQCKTGAYWYIESSLQVIVPTITTEDLQASQVPDGLESLNSVSTPTDDHQDAPEEEPVILPKPQSGHIPFDANTEPEEAWKRGKCPHCGNWLVSNLYFVGGKGYILRWECWGSLQTSPTCDYSRTL